MEMIDNGKDRKYRIYYNGEWQTMWMTDNGNDIQ